MFYKLAILEKEGAYGMVIIDYLADKDVVGNFDGRYMKGNRLEFTDVKKADEVYRTAIRNSLSRYWGIVYTGERNYG